MITLGQDTAVRDALADAQNRMHDVRGGVVRDNATAARVSIGQLRRRLDALDRELARVEEARRVDL